MKILTVAKHVFRESMRKKVLFVLGLLFLILLISSSFLEALSQEDKIKLIERISFGSMAFFGVMAVIFLSATSLPKEIEEKQIQVVTTKPISRLHFLLGKTLGLISVISLLLLLMGILSWTLVRVTAKGKNLSAKRILSPQNLTFRGEDSSTVKSLEETAGKGELSWLNGPEDLRAIWTWERLKGNLPQGEITFRVMNTTPAGGARRAKLEVRVYSPPAKTGEVQEIVVEDDTPAKFKFDNNLINPRGKLQVEVRRLDFDYALGVKRESLRLLTPPGSFDLNFLKSLLLLLFELALMVVITVMGSTFLSSMVTITLSLFIYLSGHMLEFLEEVAKTMKTTGFMIVPRHARLPSERQGHWLTQTISFFLDGFTKLFPNLRKFDASSSLIKGMDISSSWMIESFLYMSLYAVIALIIAHLFFRRKEFR